MALDEPCERVVRHSPRAPPSPEGAAVHRLRTTGLGNSSKVRNQHDTSTLWAKGRRLREGLRCLHSDASQRHAQRVGHRVECFCLVAEGRWPFGTRWPGIGTRFRAPLIMTPSSSQVRLPTLRVCGAWCAVCALELFEIRHFLPSLLEKAERYK